MKDWLVRTVARLLDLHLAQTSGPLRIQQVDQFVSLSHHERFEVLATLRHRVERARLSQFIALFCQIASSALAFIAFVISFVALLDAKYPPNSAAPPESVWISWGIAAYFIAMVPILCLIIHVHRVWRAGHLAARLAAYEAADADPERWVSLRADEAENFEAAEVVLSGSSEDHSSSAVGGSGARVTLSR